MDEGPAALSPSLRGGASKSYELKFLADAGRSAEILEWAGRHLAPDPHGDPGAGGSYDVRTLYFDTPALDVYFRRPPFARGKLRIRRYGGSEACFLERKTRRGDEVAKRRARIAPAELAGLANEAPDHAAWAWFLGRVAQGRLRPTLLISYERTAFIGEDAGGSFRLTVDDRLRAAREDGLMLGDVASGPALLENTRVIEFKFEESMPDGFKDLVQRFGLSPSPFSKYRRAAEVLGLVPDGRDAP